MMTELETFCAVVRCGNMSKAAVELHLSQPAVSQRLRSLEETYGMPLLRRTNRGVELTPGGEIVSRYARRLLSLHGTLQEEMAALRQDEPKQIVVGATSTIGSYALPCTVYEFQQKHPAAKIQLVIGKRSEVIQRMQDGLLDLAMVEGASPLGANESVEGWQSQIVSEEELVLITPISGPLTIPETYTLDDLRRAPLILRESGSASRENIESTLAERGLTLKDMNVAMEMSSLDAIKTSVVSGHGVALISGWGVRVEARIGTVRVTPLEGVKFVNPWSLIYPQGNQSILKKALIRTLRSPSERGFC